MKRLLLFIAALAIYQPAFSQCDKVKLTKDKYNPIKSYWATPSKDNISFSKHMVMDGDSINYFVLMSLKCDASSPYYSADISVKLDNGTVLEYKGVKIRPTSVRSGWYLISIVTLSDSDVEALTKSPITDYRIGIYDNTVSASKGKHAQGYIQCLAEKKL